MGGSRAQILAKADAAADFLQAHADAIIECLTRHESHETAADELARSVDALRHLHREHRNLLAPPVDSIAVFLPINLPLYSLVLFAAIPSLLARAITVRLPAATVQWLRDVADVSGLLRFFPEVTLLAATRREFIAEYAARADAVIFTGRYENAELVRRSCPHALFIYEGSGPNPIVIGPHFDLARDLARVVSPRLFNGGQDCAGPDVYLAHSSVCHLFVQEVQGILAGLHRGSFADPEVRVGPILNRGPLAQLEERLGKLAPYIVSGGRVDRAAAFVEPTVICAPIATHDQFYEFFAPIFYILEYSTPGELVAFLSRAEYREYAMYLSFFGEDPPRVAFDCSVVLRDQTILEVERGNDPYGGFGPKANYVSCGERVLSAGPILISRVLAEFGAVRRAGDA